jgi:Indole-3-glycerol phosphate synthase
MEPLVEVNSEDEMRLALTIGARLNQNLHDLKDDMETTTRLTANVPDGKDVILCVEWDFNQGGCGALLERQGGRRFGWGSVDESPICHRVHRQSVQSPQACRVIRKGNTTTFDKDL